MALPISRRLFWHLKRVDRWRADRNMGIRMAISSPMMAMMTRSSMKTVARGWDLGLRTRVSFQRDSILRCLVGAVTRTFPISARRRAVVVFMAMSGRYLAIFILLFAANALGRVAVDLSQYEADCPVQIAQEKEGLVARWNTGQGAAALTFSLEAGAPLFEKIEMEGRTLARKVDPQFVITTGSRKGQPDNRYIFFDKPASRATERHVAKLELAEVGVKSNGDRVTLSFSALSAGP